MLSLSGVGSVIWFEGINDFSKNGNVSAEAAQTALRDGVAAIKKRLPGVRVIGATVTTALGNAGPAHGFAEQDMKRQALNDFIRGSGVFNGVIDFDKVTANPETGEMQPEFVPELDRRLARRQAAPEPARLPRHGAGHRPQPVRHPAIVGKYTPREVLPRHCDGERSAAGSNPDRKHGTGTWIATAAKAASR